MLQIFIYKDGKNTGPFTRDEIFVRVRQKEFSMDDLACTEGMPEWKPLAEVLSVKATMVVLAERELPPAPPVLVVCSREGFGAARGGEAQLRRWVRYQAQLGNENREGWGKARQERVGRGCDGSDGRRASGGAWTRAWALALGFWAMLVSGAGAGELKEVWVQTSSALNPEAVFSYRVPAGGPARAMLLLVPGCNGDGRAFLKNEAVWGRFADQARLVLVGPTFKTTLDEVHSRQGYYYPELWSGAATLSALEQIRTRTGVRNEKVLVFGFSAGAHFAHRFALWRPERVGAFVAYSAGWWDAPTLALLGVPGLILCGEADERYGPTYEFFTRGRKLGLPLIWRGFTGVGHELTPQVVKLSQAFLEFYAAEYGGRAVGESRREKFAGDIQTYRFYEGNSDAAARVPEELRIALPSRHVAEVWREEK